MEKSSQNSTLRHNMQKYLSLARKLDTHYKTNKWVLILVPLLFIVGAGYSYFTAGGLVDSLLAGLHLAFHFFFAWAIARELDPDNDYSAFVAATIAVAAWWFGNYADLFVNFFLLMILRLANRSTGRKMFLADWIVLFALAIWVTIEGKYYVLPLLTLIAFADYYLKPRNKGALIPALDAVVLTAFALYYFTWPMVKVTPLLLWVFAGGLVLILFLMISTRKIISVADITQEPLHIVRLRLALWLSLIVLFVEIFFYGLPGFWDIIPLTTAVAGVAFWRPVVWVRSW